MTWAVDTNLLLWPVELDPAEPPDIRLAGAQDDLLDPALVRAYALVGPGATIAGLGDVASRVFGAPAADLLSADDPRRELPDVEALGAGLYGMARHRVGGAEAAVDEWRSGTLLPLPAQRDVDGQWVVFLDDWLASAAAHPVVVPFEVHLPAGDILGPTALTPTWGELDGKPDAPTVLTAEVRTLVSGKTGPAVGALLAPGLLANPYASAVTVVEALVQLGTRGAADDVACVTDLVARFTTPQLDLLAWTSGGNAVLRRSWPRSAPTTPAYLRTADALGLAVASGTGNARVFRPPQQRRPAKPWVEPPLAGEQAVVGGHRVAAMALGRRVTHGWDPKTVPSRPGPFRVGVIKVSTFDTSAIPAPTAETPEQTGSRRKVAVAIAGNEANFDGVRLADYAHLSLGFQQWSFHVDEEGTALLEVLRRRTPDYYDLFFGHYDLELALCDAAGKVADTLAAVPGAAGVTTEAAVRAANPHAFTGTALNDVRDYYPSHVTQLYVQPDRDPLVLGNKLEEATTRRDFFGWTPARNKKGEIVSWTGAPEWGARCTVAAQCTQALLEGEVAAAAYRFTRLEDEAVGWSADWRTPASSIDHPGQPVAPTGLRLLDLCPTDHTVQELFGSEYAAALLIDHYINSPAMVPGAIGRSWQRAVESHLEQARAQLLAETGAQPADDEVAGRAHALMHGGGEELSDGFLARFAGGFATIRERKVSTKAKEDRQWMAHYVARTRGIIVQHDHWLSTTPGSFLGWS